MHPDEILAQIQDLADQYIQAGGDPAQLQDAVSGSPAGDQPDAGAPDAGAPEGNLADALSGMGGGGAPEGPPSTGDPFKDATAAAHGDIKAAQAEAGTKTGIPEQFLNKKRAKA